MCISRFLQQAVIVDQYRGVESWREVTAWECVALMN